MSAGTGVTKASQAVQETYCGAIISILCRDRLGNSNSPHRRAGWCWVNVEQYTQIIAARGLVTLVNKLKQRTACEPASVAIGIEVAWGALVETLVESGFSLFSINPKQIDRFRDRFTVAGAKDDARDALVLASSLLTDKQSYKRLDIDCPD